MNRKDRGYALVALMGMAMAIALVSASRTAKGKAVRQCHQAVAGTEPGLGSHEPEADTVIEFMDLGIFRRRIGDIFPNGYLMALAIIQGVALGLLLSTTVAQWHDSPRQRALIAAQAFAVFTAIVVVTHRYLLLTIMARWVPTIFDTLIPFYLGVGEIVSALFIGRFVVWWGGALTFATAGIGAYAHSRIRASRISFGQMVEIYWRFRRITKRAIVCLGLLVAISVSIIALNPLHIWPFWLKSLSPILFVIDLIVLEIMGNYGLGTPVDRRSL